MGCEYTYPHAGHFQVLDEGMVAEGTCFHAMQRRILEDHGEQRVGTEGVASNSAYFRVHESYLCS